MTPLHRCAPEEYLARECNAGFRSEYIDGRIIVIAPGESRPHNLIVTALLGELGRSLGGGLCEVYATHMRVKVSASGDYLYPDVMVSCDPRSEDNNYDTLLTPVLIIEVLSDSTERRDREEKFPRYKRIESLREYVLISQKEPRIEQCVRSGDLWPRAVVTGTNASLALASVGVEIPLKRLYQKALLPTRRVPRLVQDEE